MKIAYHSDAFAGRVGYGLGRYARELWQALCRQDSALDIVPFALRGDRPVQHVINGSRRPAEVIRPQGDGRLYMALWATLRIPNIEHWICDLSLVHSVELDYPVATQKPWIVTVHDLGPLTHHEYFSKSRPWLTRRALDRAVKKASYIVAVSSATAEAVERMANISLGDRLRIIPEGVSREFFEKQSSDCLDGLSNLPLAEEKYFLWTGSLNPRKNLQNVIRAFELVADDIPHHLVLAGGLGWDSGKVLASIDSSRFRARIHRPGHVSDAQLRALYQNAHGFVYVSLMEGFGLPILEAMASGCPVITSNVSSMPEVAGDAAILVNPTRERDIAEAMCRLANDERLRGDLAARGRVRAAQYSWENCASKMLDLYRSACG